MVFVQNQRVLVVDLGQQLKGLAGMEPIADLLVFAGLAESGSLSLIAIEVES